MAAITVLKFMEVDVRKIVNNEHTRIVTDEDVKLMQHSFLEHGYIPTASAITVRYATIPEICQFYQRSPHNYSLDNAKKLTDTFAKDSNFAGHVYCYDGLIRKAALQGLQEAQLWKGSSTLRAMLVPEFSPRQAIAYGLAQNSVNGISIKLSPLEVLLACREYDNVYNVGKDTKANQTDVAKSMVNESVPPNTPEETKKKQAETRRQIIGVSRKLPESAFVFFKSLLKSDITAARNAFTTANLKAIPKTMNENAVVCLLKRFQKGYHDHMPKPKPFDPQQVKEQTVLTREAFKQMEKFIEKCGFGSMPQELADICSSMTSSQNYDWELRECESSASLFPQLVEQCRKRVPGGDLKMIQVEEEVDSGPKTPLKATGCSEISVEDPFNNEECVSVAKCGRGGNSRKKENTPKNKNNSGDILEDITEAESIPSVCGNVSVPNNWILESYDCLEFEKLWKHWDDRVSHVCDFAIMRIPIEERSEAIIAKYITHLGHALHRTGVAHVFCMISQYGIIENAVKEAGMYMARDASLYIYDSTKMKRLTLSGQPQPIHQCAAVFWREPQSARKKHHFSAEVSCQNSAEPGWVNVITGVTPPEKLRGAEYCDTGVEIFPMDLNRMILQQWCKPGGVCYDATAGAMDIGVAARDLGMTYIGIEKDRSVFEVGKARLFETSPSNGSSMKRKPAKKRHAMADIRGKRSKKHFRSLSPDCSLFSSDGGTEGEDDQVNENSNECALGDLCIFAGKDQEPSHSCPCGKKVHNLCDFGRRNPRLGSEDHIRETEWACSMVCVEKYWPLE